MNRLLRKIFRPNRDNVTRGWRNVSDLKALWFVVLTECTDVEIKETEMGGARDTFGEENKFIQEFGGKA